MTLANTNDGDRTQLQRFQRVAGVPVRYPEIGRLRMGEKGDRGEPKRLTTWRATSADQEVINRIAGCYGGIPRKWEDAPAGEQWQVVTQTSEIDVVIPALEPYMLAYERWGAGGIARRCDGVHYQQPSAEAQRMVDGGTCWCQEKGLWPPGDGKVVKHGGCDIALRLRVIVPDVPGLGVWLVTSGSFNGAAELPGQLQLLAAAAEQGTFVPAVLAIEERKVKKAWEKFPRQFVVPVLRSRVSINEMGGLGAPREPVEIGPPVRPGMPAVQRAAIEAGDAVTDEQLAAAAQDKRRERAVMACVELGLDDQQRHDLIGIVTQGRTASSRDIGDAELSALLAAVEMLKNGTRVLGTDREGRPALLHPQFGWPSDVPTVAAAEDVVDVPGDIPHSSGASTTTPTDLDAYREWARTQLRSYGDAGKQAWADAGLPKLADLTEEQVAAAQAVLDDLSERPF